MRRSLLTLGLAVDHPALHFGGTAHRVDDARKLHQQAVTGGLDDAAPVLPNLRIDQLPAMRVEAFERTLLVRPHQPRIARHIGGEDRGKSAGGGRGVHCWAALTLAANLTFRAVTRHVHAIE
jgi:hypothetical protein